jgi:hypothetical protein
MSFEDRIKQHVNVDHTKLTRQQRRQMERSGKKFESRNSFSKKELEEANAVAYEYGKQLTIKAAAKVLGLGEKRLQRITEELARQEYETFVKPFDDLRGADHGK